MKPEDVPVQFAQTTVQLAMTTWLMGATLFKSDNAQTLGQLFSILAGQRLRAEGRGVTVDPAAVLTEFRQRMQGQVPPGLIAEFSTLEPVMFDTTYQSVLSVAREYRADLEEFASALVEIAAVTRYASSQMKGLVPDAR